MTPEDPWTQNRLALLAEARRGLARELRRSWADVALVVLGIEIVFLAALLFGWSP